MDENILAALIGILQKHANAIRKLQAANIALMELARQEAVKTGESAQEFEKRFLGLLATVGDHAPGPLQNIAKEIEQDVAEMDELDRLQKMKPN